MKCCLNAKIPLWTIWMVFRPEKKWKMSPNRIWVQYDPISPKSQKYSFNFDKYYFSDFSISILVDFVTWVIACRNYHVVVISLFFGFMYCFRIVISFFTHLLSILYTATCIRYNHVWLQSFSTCIQHALSVLLLPIRYFRVGFS